MTVITTGSFVFRAEQENGDHVDCVWCGERLNDDLDDIVSDQDGWAYCSPAHLLAQHDEGEELHPYVASNPHNKDDEWWWQCKWCGDTAEGLMHNNTERNIEPLLWGF